MRRRHTRSFVRREGRMTPRQEQAFHMDSSAYLMDHLKPIDFKMLFSEKPVTLEIGFGMGASLAQMAQLQPEIQFIGVEVHRPGVGALLATLNEESISNVRIINTDVIHLLNELLPNAFLDRVLIFFPDPWPKKRHHKRRLIQDHFIRLLMPKLKPGALLHFATDWEPYANHVQAVMEGFSDCFSLLSPEQNSRPETKFERRGLRLGHAIVDLLYYFDPE